MDIAGVVEAVGDEVTGFAPGDEVIAMLGGDFGGHAEYVRIPQSKAIARKPRNLDMGDAAALVFGGHTALAFLDHVELGPGSEVLVNGASGAVGTAAVQLAKQRGATVTAVCGGRHADLVSSLGADRVIDRTREDFTADGAQYDVIVECGGDAPFERVEHSLKPGGALLLVIADLHGMLDRVAQRRDAAASSSRSPGRPCRTRTWPASPASPKRGPSARSSTAPTTSTTWPRRTATSTPAARRATWCSASRRRASSRSASPGLSGTGQRVLDVDCGNGGTGQHHTGRRR